MSIRFRLTLFYSFIMMLFLIGFSLISYAYQSQSEIRVMSAELQDAAKGLLESPVFAMNEIPSNIAVQAFFQFNSPSTYIQTIDANGDLVSNSLNMAFDEVEIPYNGPVQDILRLTGPWVDIADGENERVLVHNEPIILPADQPYFSTFLATRYGNCLQLSGDAAADSDCVEGVLQLGRSLAEHDATMAELRQTLITGNFFALAGSFLVGWLFAGIALRPIHRVAETARAIGQERDFNRRMDYDGPQDEIGELVTTFNEMLTELQATHQQTRQMLQVQRRFTADASHELRTPLTTLRGNVELLKHAHGLRDGDRDEILIDMVDETDRMIHLVGDLLTLARADSRQPLTLVPIPLNQIVEDVHRKVKALDARRCCNHSAPDEDISVIGNADALKQVLWILLDNALKHTPEDCNVETGIKLNGTQAIIFVKDDGPGIKPEDQEMIFDRFYQIDESRTGAGTGLGLAIAKTLVEKQSGTIEVESEPGKGTKFTVKLPIAQGPVMRNIF